MVQPLGETLSMFLTKLDKVLQYDPATTLLGIYPTDLKMSAHECLRQLYS